MGLEIPPNEVTFNAVRSSGPGGQHVNTSATKVVATWDFASSALLTEVQKDLLKNRLTNRLDSEERLQVTVSDTRSQQRNKLLALERLNEMVQIALKPRKPRKKTRRPARAEEKRLAEKKQRGELKKLRQKPPPEE